MLQLRALPAFNDNYIWVFGQQDSGRVCVVDPGMAAPVLQLLQREGLQLEAIVLTHHHGDHIGGVEELLQQANVPVYGPHSARMGCVSHAVGDGDELELAGLPFRVLEVPGHTREHIAWFCHAVATCPQPLLFCGDTLFAAGCGRMFEGTPPQMHASLQRLAALPPETRVCCAHEYTLSNLRFAAAVMPRNTALQQRTARASALREQGLPTLPSLLADELATNPFLRCSEAEVVVAARQFSGDPALAEPAAVFGALRRWKDGF
jgi:hydroxyacylglutathione hydrolase